MIIIFTGSLVKSIPDGLYDVPIQSSDYEIQEAHQGNEVNSDTEAPGHTSALGLLALTYGNSSDSEDDQVEADVSDYDDKTNGRNFSSESRYQNSNSALSSLKQDLDDNSSEGHSLSPLRLVCEDEGPIEIIDSYAKKGCGRANFANRSYQTYDCSVQFEAANLASVETNSSECTFTDLLTNSNFSNSIVPLENTNMSFAGRSHDDSSRMHVFCLEHAVEVEQQLRPIGGVHIMLLCHPGASFIPSLSH